jgi:hypothetical protein
MTDTGWAALVVVLVLGPFFIVRYLRRRKLRGRLEDLEERLDALWRRSTRRRPLDFLTRPERRRIVSLRHRMRRISRLLRPLEEGGRRAPGEEAARREATRPRPVRIGELERRLAAVERSLEEPEGA